MISRCLAKINLTSGSISVAVDRLEERGLVEPRSDSDDGRTRVVHLTADGRELIEEAFASHAAAMEKATAALTCEERRQALALLRKLGLGASAITTPGKTSPAP